jgi:cell division protein FtsQ
MALVGQWCSTPISKNCCIEADMMAVEPGTQATQAQSPSPSLTPAPPHTAPTRTVPLRFLVAVLVAGFLLTVVAMRWQGTRTISHIAVTGTTLIPTHEIVERVSLPNDSLTINEMSFALIEKRVRTHPFVKTVSAFRSSGDAIMLRVQERIPVAHVLYKGKQYYVDAEGAVLPYRLVGSLDIPIIALLGRTTLDSATLHTSLTVLETLSARDKELARNVSELQVRPHTKSSTSPEFTLITATGATPVMFGSAENSEEIEAKVARLSLFWRTSSALVAKKAFAYIDIRWSGQVVTQPAPSVATAASQIRP